MWELSGYNRVAPQWAVHYSLTYTSWSQFQELKATGSNGQTLFYKEEGFKDAYRLALGTTYYYDDNWTFRTGIASMTARCRLITALSLFRTRIACG